MGIELAWTFAVEDWQNSEIAFTTCNWVIHVMYTNQHKWLLSLMSVSALDLLLKMMAILLRYGYQLLMQQAKLMTKVAHFGTVL